MRVTIAAVLFLLPCSAFAQSWPSDAVRHAAVRRNPCAPIASALQFDPYKPSHTAIIRNYGATLLAQAPLSDLLALDPYVPSQAALLRQLGGAIPLWGFPMYPAYPAYPVYQAYPPPAPYPPARHGAPCGEPARAQAPMLTTVNELLQVLEQRRDTTATTTKPSSTAAPGRSRGISILHAGRVWISAGHAVRFSEAEFVDIAESTAAPVFRRRGGDDSLIYVPTTPGMVAPFRAAKQADK
jgi:hypothetical protein